jgi:hypothetical protein
MRKLADRLEYAGKWASLAAVLLVALSVANPSGIMLALTFLCIAPAYMMSAIADWLRTKSALEALWSHQRTAATSPSAASAACKPLASAEHSDHWPNQAIDWDSPSPSIH